jgi:hypothetical protein
MSSGLSLSSMGGSFFVPCNILSLIEQEVCKISPRGEINSHAWCYGCTNEAFKRMIIQDSYKQHSSMFLLLYFLRIPMASIYRI